MLFSLPKMCWETQAGKAFCPMGSRTSTDINHALFSIKGMTLIAAVGDAVSPIRYRMRVAYINSWREWESWNNMGTMTDKWAGVDQRFALWVQVQTIIFISIQYPRKTNTYILFKKEDRNHCMIEWGFWMKKALNILLGLWKSCHTEQVWRTSLELWAVVKQTSKHLSIHLSLEIWNARLIVE